MLPLTQPAQRFHQPPTSGFQGTILPPLHVNRSSSVGSCGRMTQRSKLRLLLRCFAWQYKLYFYREFVLFTQEE